MRTTSLTSLFLLVTACSGADVAPGTDAGLNPTYYENVAHITAKNCVVCHFNGVESPAPFALETYADVMDIGAAGLLTHVTETRQMPPWPADASGDCNTFKDQLWLSEDEIATIRAWVDAGMPEGDPANAPPLAPPIEHLTTATHVLDMGSEYVSGQPLSDDYRCFIVDPNIDRDMFLVAFEAVTSEPKVAHHMILFSLDTADAEAEALALDAADPALGYECFGGPGTSSSRFVGGWVPGMGVVRFQGNSGVRLKGNRKLILQMHYNYAEGLLPDRTQFQMDLRDSVEREGFFYNVSANDLVLPPGQQIVESTNTEDLPGSGMGTVWAIVPHMHTIGKTIKVQYEGPSDTTCLVDVDRWDFEWQRLYQYDQSISIAGGGQFRITCGHDTTGRTETTYWGEGSADEMCLAYLYVTQ